MGLKLKIKRIEKGIKQKDLAELVGISYQYLSKLESTVATNPSNKIMVRIAEVLECPIQDIFF